MSDREFIAERSMIALSANGDKFSVHLRVGKPYKVDESEWACAVELEGLYNNLADQHGIDSWQALQLSRNLIVNLLCYFVEDGGCLKLVDSDDPFTVQELKNAF